jgi:tetratricopeptide (TPR) repeat protein
VGEAAPPVAAPRDRRVVWVGVALGAVAVAALLVGRAVRSDVVAAKVDSARVAGGASGSGTKASTKTSTKTATATSAGAASPAPPASADSQERLAEARRLLARGDWEQARAALESLRAAAPDDPETAYLLATIDLEHHRFAEGLAAAQVAARKNPALKSDPDLVKDVIQALSSDQSAERAESFLRAAGPPATPFIKDAARRDPNPRVRDRAAALLSREGHASYGWPSRSSSGSVFHR